MLDVEERSFWVQRAGDAGLPGDTYGAEEHRRSVFQVKVQKHLVFLVQRSFICLVSMLQIVKLLQEHCLFLYGDFPHLEVLVITYFLFWTHWR